MTHLQFFGFLILIVIALLAAGVNDTRITRHQRDTRLRLDAATAERLRLEGNQSALRVLVHAHRRDVLTLDEELHDAQERIASLEGKELYRIFAEHLRDGTFKHIRKRHSPRKGRGA